MAWNKKVRVVQAKLEEAYASRLELNADANIRSVGAQLVWLVKGYLDGRIKLVDPEAGYVVPGAEDDDLKAAIEAARGEGANGEGEGDAGDEPEIKSGEDLREELMAIEVAAAKGGEE